MSDSTLKVSLPARPRRTVLIEPAPPKDAPDACRDAEERDRLLEEAYRSGYEEAAQTWSARLNEVLRSLDKEATALAHCRREFLEALERHVIDLGIAVAEKFLLGERDQRHYRVADLVHGVLERLEHKGGRLTVVLNPEDLEAYKRQGRPIEDDAFESIRVAADPEVPLAGCRLETGLGRVTSSLEEQMEDIRRLLKDEEVCEDDECRIEPGAVQAELEPARSR